MLDAANDFPDPAYVSESSVYQNPDFQAPVLETKLFQGNFADQQDPALAFFSGRPCGCRQSAGAHHTVFAIQYRPQSPFSKGDSVPPEKLLYFDGVLTAHRAVTVSLAPVPKDQTCR